MAGRSSNGDPPAIDRIVDIGQRSSGARRSSAEALAAAAGQNTGKMAIGGLPLLVIVRLPGGDRPEIAETVIAAVQGHENRPITCRCANLEIRQKSGKNRPGTARFMFCWDVSFSVILNSRGQVDLTDMQNQPDGNLIHGF